MSDESPYGAELLTRALRETFPSDVLLVARYQEGTRAYVATDRHIPLVVTWVDVEPSGRPVVSAYSHLDDRFEQRQVEFKAGNMADLIDMLVGAVKSVRTRADGWPAPVYLSIWSVWHTALGFACRAAIAAIWSPIQSEDAS